MKEFRSRGRARSLVLAIVALLLASVVFDFWEREHALVRPEGAGQIIYPICRSYGSISRKSVYLLLYPVTLGNSAREIEFAYRHRVAIFGAQVLLTVGFSSILALFPFSRRL